MQKLKRRPIVSEEKEVFEYTIGSTIYTQKKMTLGQVKMVNKLFGSVEIPTNFNAVSLFTTFSGQLSEFMAIVLCKKGTALKDKDFEALREEFDDDGDLDVGFKVVQDFFVCNPIASYFDQMMVAFQKLTMASRPEVQSTNG
jgi:hypothetical protein